MHPLIRTVVFVVSLLCALPVHAQLLDQMLTVQAATTSVGRASDSTTVSAQPGQEMWGTRRFTATTSKACVSGSDSTVGIANAGTGITNVDIRNASGEVSITWSFGAGIPASRFSQSAFDFYLVNTSRAGEIAVRTVATLSTNSSDITLGYPGVIVDRKLTPNGKIVPFRFDSASPSLLKNSGTVIRSLTLRLSSPSACDVSFAVHSVRFISRSLDKSKSKAGGENGSVSSNLDDGALPQGTAVATTPQAQNPCNEDPTVPEQIRDCEEKINFIAAECMSWKCECVPSRDNKRPLVQPRWSAATTMAPAGKDCTNKFCGGIPGKCSDFGQCLPAQFYGYNNPSIAVTADQISYRTDAPETKLDKSCFDEKKQPQGRQLCTLTVAQLEEAFLASMMVGAPCKLSPGKMGVCSNVGQCVPDTSANFFCKDQVDCTRCGAAGNICWKKECLTNQEASRKLCEATHVRGGGKGICSPCFATFKINPDGVCGTGVLAPDARGVSMEGASCSRYQSGSVLTGTCRSGQCMLTPPVTASPTASPVK